MNIRCTDIKSDHGDGPTKCYRKKQSEAIKIKMESTKCTNNQQGR
jgi:hypothetical protein